MNDYDNNYGSENVNGEVNGGAVQENTDEKENLIITEVQIGDYLGEDDIVRYEDIYGRN